MTASQKTGLARRPLRRLDAKLLRAADADSGAADCGAAPDELDRRASGAAERVEDDALDRQARERGAHAVVLNQALGVACAFWAQPATQELCKLVSRLLAHDAHLRIASRLVNGQLPQLFGQLGEHAPLVLRVCEAAV